MQKRMFVGLFLSLMAGVLLCGNTSYARTGSDEIAMGVYVGEVNVSGMTKEEAITAVNEYVAGKAEEKITLTINEKELEITNGDLGISWNNPEIVDEALALGKSGNLIKRYKSMKDLEFDNKIYEMDYTADNALIQSVVTEQCTKYNQKPVNLGLKKTDSGFQIVDGEPGIAVDEGAAVETIFNYISEEYVGEEAKIDIPTMVTEPEGSAEATKGNNIVMIKSAAITPAMIRFVFGL